jgi:hypothetical protein
MKRAAYIVIITVLVMLAIGLQTNMAQLAPATLVTIQTNNAVILKLDVLSASNIKEWTNSIKDLWRDPGDSESWLFSQSPTNKGVSIILEDPSRGRQVEFRSNAFELDVTSQNGDIETAEIQSSWMNIDNTKALGDALLQFLGQNQTEFDEWCGTNGNKWVGAKLFASSGTRMVNSGKIYAFNILRSYNNEQPWIIDLVITNP